MTDAVRYDPLVSGEMWLMADYSPVPIPRACTDRTFGSWWSRGP